MGQELGLWETMKEIHGRTFDKLGELNIKMRKLPKFDIMSAHRDDKQVATYHVRAGHAHRQNHAASIHQHREWNLRTCPLIDLGSV